MSEPDFWNHMTHEEIFAAVHSGPGPGISMEAEQMWREAREIIIAAEALMHTAVVDSQQQWESHGADAARSGLSSLNAWALGAADDAYSTLLAIDGQAGSAATVRRNVAPPYGDVLFAAQSDALLNPGSRSAADRLAQVEANAATVEVQERGENARAALAEYVRQSYVTLTTMDYWSIPPVVTVDTSPIAPAGAGGAGAAGGPGASVLTPVGFSGGGAPAGSSLGGGVPGAPGAGGPIVPGGAGSGIGAVPAGSPIGLPPGAVPAGGGVSGARAGSVSGAGPAGGAPVPVMSTGTGGGSFPGAGRAGGAGGASGDRAAGAGGAPAGLRPGAGGRGVRPAPETGPYGSGGVRPVSPGAPLAVAPSPTWRDVVAGGAPGGRPGIPTGSPGGGGAPVNPLTPRGDAGPRITPVATAVGETARGGHASGTHGLYPPMAGGAGPSQGAERRRTPYLVDDSGVFDVDVPYTDPVIGGELPTGPPREA